MRRAIWLVLLVGFAAGCARTAHPAPSEKDRYVAAYERLHPSVVLLTMQIPAIDPKRKGEWTKPTAAGSWSRAAPWGTRILTDAHVVDDARDLVATIGDGPHAAARVVAAHRCR